MSEILEKRSGACVMRKASLRDDLVFVAGPRQWGDNRKSWLSRAARVCGVSFRQAKSIFYGEMRDPRSSIEQAVRDAARQKRDRQARLADADAVEAVATALEHTDEAFHRDEIARLRALAAEFRDMGRDRPVAGPSIMTEARR